METIEKNKQNINYEEMNQFFLKLGICKYNHEIKKTSTEEKIDNKRQELEKDFLTLLWEMLIRNKNIIEASLIIEILVLLYKSNSEPEEKIIEEMKSKLLNNSNI